jgi:hypothetical protein
VSDINKWTASKSGTGGTELIKLFQDSEPLTFCVLFELLQDDQDFADWYTDLLKNAPSNSYFWEHPPLTTSGFEQAAEFVMIDAPILDSMRPNTEAFRSYFAGEDVATFRNLGGDAILIAPSPDDASFAYPHLGAFLQKAPDQKIRKLWHSVGQAVCGALSDQPTWLSTSGLGIAWLHIRLDSYPKYYQHQPYKRWPLANGHDEH